ncbi:Microtubules assembly and stabilization protein [Neonectria magnoliae]|uniref:Microtubules assembly and stabilization protein n=1 Tax=Neonectria magnoliae TaxID=2732573 RepID=A0ABR1I9E0_9HYPO
MEQVHGVDVSWMTHGAPRGMYCPNRHPSEPSREKVIKNSPPSKTPTAALPRQIPGASARAPASVSIDHPTNGQATPPNGTPTQRRLSRSGSIDNKPSPTGTPPQRRTSWFSNISAKFSSSAPPATPTSSPQPPQSPTAQEDPLPPKITPTKNAVLQHAAKPEGNGPYTPAPPRSTQAGFLGVFRRLSSSSSGALGTSGRLGHGLVDRMVLNVDEKRERCPISELHGAKLRRVAFCVDVEIAPMPKYVEPDTSHPKPVDLTQKKKITEKGEGDALKNPKPVEEQKETVDVTKSNSEPTLKESEKEGLETTPTSNGLNANETTTPAPAPAPAPEKEKENTKKKEKKKKSEEERKARKEKKRKLAEANGSIPMEIHYSSDSSCNTSPGALTPKTSSSPTTNPVRIYRRCCQLRETPILKKITEQLTNPANYSSSSGMVSKLDLTDYWLQLPDLVTLGDYLAIVPVREVFLENIGLTDEGLRVILAGLLAAKRPPSKKRRPKHEGEEHGNVVERLVLKNNKLGPDGWKHLSLFIYFCRSLKFLDLSQIQFPRQPQANQNGALPNGAHIPRSISDIFSKALGERLGGSTLELVNLGETGPSMEQLGTIIDGLIQCGVGRLGLAHNQIDDEGVQHIVRYVAAGKCEGVDLGGNDLGAHMEALASAIGEDSQLWAMGLAGCNLTPSSLCKILPTLVKLKSFRFIDLSQNQALFTSTPSAVGLLRRYLPKMAALKRIHLEDVQMTSEQAIALVEVLPEVHQLAHINLLGNSELMKLGNARTEEAQEEACALYASLLAAARVSKNLICVDIEVPSERSGEIVKAMAKQVVAYCLRNMERIQDADVSAAVTAALTENHPEGLESKAHHYPDVLAHLVGHDVLDQDDFPDDASSAPDEDYVIGGTGVVKALTCCLKNRGDESRRQSGEFIRDVENGVASPGVALTSGGKAKDMSKHLLAGARKIRLRLQPALNKARANPGDEQNLRKLMFLDDTLEGIIKRFEDEYPDTREPVQEPRAPVVTKRSTEELPVIVPPVEDPSMALSDNEDESEFNVAKPLSRSNSMLSRTLVEEEGRILRAGHRFRVGFFKQEQLDLLNTIDDIGSDPKHVRMLSELAEDIGGELLEKVKEKGPVRAFKEHGDIALKNMEENDPEHWERFAEAQHKARANITVPSGIKSPETQAADESAIAD